MYRGDARLTALGQLRARAEDMVPVTVRLVGVRDVVRWEVREVVLNVPAGAPEQRS